MAQPTRSDYNREEIARFLNNEYQDTLVLTLFRGEAKKLAREFPGVQITPKNNVTPPLRKLAKYIIRRK